MSETSRKIIEAIAVTAELTGTQLSLEAARIMDEDLACYPEQDVLKALARCRRELKSRLTLAEIISRIDDGRPGPEEAWAMIPKDERSSVVWTEEMAEAFGVCYSLIESGDNVQARMAFIEAYRDRVMRARDNKSPIVWRPSLGHDPRGRESVLLEAVEKGRLEAKYAASLIPALSATPEFIRLMDLAKSGGQLRLVVNGDKRKPKERKLVF